MKTYRDVESTWGFTLPERFAELYVQHDWDALRLPDKSIFNVPWPILTPKEICSAYDLREDWEIPASFVPFIGDFHDLICLDFSADTAAVVAVSDDRKVRHLFDDFNTFLDARFLNDNEPGDSPDIIEGESWLDI